jgi:TonB family protein
MLIAFWLSWVASDQTEAKPQSETPQQVGEVRRVVGSVSAPVAIYKVEPEYTEEARKARFQGMVALSIVVDENGLPRNFKVVKPMGVGLDEKAIAAVQQWRFKPAQLNGKPVAVLAAVEVNFRLLSRAQRSARLNFALQPGTTRPELTYGEVPGDPATSGDQFLRIRIQVNEEGKPRNLTVLESTDKHWAGKTLAELRSWRFRPAMANGSPVPVEGVLELTHGHERPAVQKVAP